MWTKVVESGRFCSGSGQSGSERMTSRSQVLSKPISSPAILFAPFTAENSRRSRPADVSWQSPNARGRKGPFEGSLGIQARDRREVRERVLHNQPRWQECLGLSLRGMATDRGEAAKAAHLQSDQEEVFKPHQLLRA